MAHFQNACKPWKCFRLVLVAGSAPSFRSAKDLEVVEVHLHVHRPEHVHVTVTGPLSEERERVVIEVDG